LDLGASNANAHVGGHLRLTCRHLPRRPARQGPQWTAGGRPRPRRRFRRPPYRSHSRAVRHDAATRPRPGRGHEHERTARLARREPHPGRERLAGHLQEARPREQDGAAGGL